MLQIACPYCGTRDEDEFKFGGQAHVVRPGLEVSDAVWADYQFNKENTRGIHYERWFHPFGCGRWFNVVRHTVSHEILSVYPMGQAKPTLAGGAR